MKTNVLLAAAVHLAAAFGISAQSTAPSAAPVRAFVGARIIPVVGKEIDDGVMLVREGKILAVGPRGTIAVPAGAVVTELGGKLLLPGFVDTHSHIGVPEGGDDSSPIQPACRVLDSIDVRDSSLQRAQAGGVTCANVMPGSGHLLSGQTLYLKLRDGKTIDDLTIVNADGSIAGGVKMANGTNSRRPAPFPGTRAKSAALVREQYVKALDYRRKIVAAGTDAAKAPDRDLGLEMLLEVLDKKRIVHHHTHRHDDIVTVLRLQKEFGFKVVLHHVSEGLKAADEIAAAHVPCSVIMVDSPGGKLEAKDLSWSTCGILEKAGVATAIHTDDPITDSRLLNRSAALAMRAGFSRQGALEALTIAGARMLEVDARIGSLEAGKDADFVVWSGDPFTLDAKVLETWIEGVRVFDRASPADLKFAEGGPGAGSKDVHFECCFPTEEN